MYYTIYKITNKLNGNFYIGKHKTKNLDDGYMGSGKLIKMAIKKYGIENFSKEILEIFDTEEEMNAAEVRLVVLGEGSYNLCPGGQGGWGYIKEQGIKGFLGKKHTVEFRSKKSQLAKLQPVTEKKRLQAKNLNSEYFKKHNKYVFSGKRHSEQTLELMRLKKVNHGIWNTNSQFGTQWITNGIINKKIKQNSFIPEGWYKGRVIKKTKTSVECELLVY